MQLGVRGVYGAWLRYCWPRSRACGVRCVPIAQRLRRMHRERRHMRALAAVHRSVGFYHESCAGVDDADDDDDVDDDAEWVCRLCRAIPGPLPQHAVVMPTR